MDTNSAIRKICNLCNYREEDIGYAGLKDSQAETLQRISLWNGQKECLSNINHPKIKILNPVKQKYGISVGDLFGNHFQVLIRNPDNLVSESDRISFCKDAESQGFLNFYGLQRFGSKRPILHLFGRYLLQGQYSEAIDAYLGTFSELEHESISKLRKMYINGEPISEIRAQYSSSYSFERKMLLGLIKGYSVKKIIHSLPEYFLRLAISSYQSYLFNQLLTYLHSQNYQLDSETKLPLVGHSSDFSDLPHEIRNLLIELLSKDNLNLNSFRHQIKKISSKGTERLAIIKPTHVKLFPYNEGKKNIKVQFSLPKGSYGTIFLREIIKKPI
jgi:tRNA pseudouridine13 synthase